MEEGVPCKGAYDVEVSSEGRFRMDGVIISQKDALCVYDELPFILNESFNLGFKIPSGHKVSELKEEMSIESALENKTDYLSLFNTYGGQLREYDEDIENMWKGAITHWMMGYLHRGPGIPEKLNKLSEGEAIAIYWVAMRARFGHLKKWKFLMIKTGKESTETRAYLTKLVGVSTTTKMSDEQAIQVLKDYGIEGFLEGRGVSQTNAWGEFAKNKDGSSVKVIWERNQSECIDLASEAEAPSKMGHSKMRASDGIPLIRDARVHSKARRRKYR